MKRPTATIAAALAATVAISGASAAYAAEAGVRDLRVLPYLQNPAADQMTITWFSATAESGRLVVRGPGGAFVRQVEARYEPALEYTDLERSQEIPGLEQGSWLHAGGNFKHTVTLHGLKPGARYRYRVIQGKATAHGRFETAPKPGSWKRIRAIAFSDSETEPLGRVQRREWAPGATAAASEPRPSSEPSSTWDTTFGTTTLSGKRVLRYPLTEDAGLRRNLDVLESREPDVLMVTGDLVQGGGYQPGWDEFFRHTAGEEGSLLSRVPVLPALGNWESYGALNGGYGTPDDRSPVVRSRAKYHAYFDAPDNGFDAHRDDYYRIDYGPLTVLTLDSNNGEPDDSPERYPAGEKLTGTQYTGPGTDTQSNFTRSEYEAAGGTDLADFGPGSRQWNWVEQELRRARARGQIVFVQFHHAPYSSGEHGLPMNHALTSAQGGTPMRVYTEMFERYGVTAVISGHSEMFERSFVDTDGDGMGVHYYDVGVGGDGLRGSRRNGASLDDPLLGYNPYSEWTADQDEPERWVATGGTPRLASGGKHYGHLEIDVERSRGRGATEATVTLTPVHVFPVLDEQLRLLRTERRQYSDRVVLRIGSDGAPLGR